MDHERHGAGTGAGPKATTTPWARDRGHVLHVRAGTVLGSGTLGSASAMAHLYQHAGDTCPSYLRYGRNARHSSRQHACTSHCGTRSSHTFRMGMPATNQARLRSTSHAGVDL